MDEAWILQESEIRLPFSRATWIPLRASLNEEKGSVKEVGFIGDVFACGSVAFPNKHREVAERLSWSDIGTGHTVAPYAYSDGHYSPIDEYQCNDKEPIGITRRGNRADSIRHAPDAQAPAKEPGVRPRR